MFDIEYKGANTVIITTKKTKLVIDPRLSVAGLKDIMASDAVELATEDRLAVNSSTRLVIASPGNFEIDGVAIVGVAAQRHIDRPEEAKQSTIYRIEIGDIRLAVIGNIAPELSDDQLEAIGVIDMAIIPVGGGGYTLDTTAATAIVRQLEPKFVIPVHYADSELKYEVPQQNFEEFVAELGAPVLESGPKLKIKNPGSLPDQLTVVQVARS